MEKPLVFCMVPCCLLPDWEYLVISDFWKKKPADLRIKTSSLSPPLITADEPARQAIIIPSSYDGLWRIISTASEASLYCTVACRNNEKKKAKPTHVSAGLNRLYVSVFDYGVTAIIN